MMKVCYVAEVGSRIAGSEFSLLSIIEEMKKKGVEPYLVCHKQWELVEEVQKLGVKTKVINTKAMTVSKRYCSFFSYVKAPLKVIFNYSQLGKIKKYLISNNIQLVHINSTLASEMWCLAAKECNIPCVWHIREYLDLDHNKVIFNKKYFYSVIKKADARIAISKNVQNVWEKRLKKSCRVIYNGLPTKELYQECSEKEHDEIVRLLCIGRIIEGKGQMDVVKAVEQLVKEGKGNIHLTIIGYRGITPYELKLKDYIKEHQLENNITVENYTYNLKEYRKKCDIGILCSVAEAFGRVTIEYMMAGMVAIGTNSGGTPELIENGKTGYLYQSGNYSELADIIKNIMDNPGMANVVAQNGQRKALVEFSMEKTANKIYELYEELIKYKIDL